VQDTIAILRGLKERYEVHHHVTIQDNALVAAATLSNRYIADRFLPDKAIDLVDEAASKIRIEIDSLPTEIDEVDRRIMQLEIELTSLKKEKDAASKERRQAIERELDELKERSAAMKAQWQSEKDAIKGVSDLKERLEQARIEVERAQRETDYERASKLQYEEIPDLERQLSERESDEREHAEETGAEGAGAGSRDGASGPQFLKRRSTPTTSPRSSRAGPASPSAA